MPREEKGKEFIPIGRIIGAHGVHGRVKLLYFSKLKAFPYSKIYLKETTGTYRGRKVSASLPLKGVFALKLEGIMTRTDAQSLTGKLAYYPKEDFAKAESDEFYWIDLIGMTVIEPSRSQLGRIKGVIETGGTDVLEIAFEDREYLVPLSYNWIENISLEGKRLVLKEGTLEFFNVH